jgi:hypothetical protein
MLARLNDASRYAEVVKGFFDNLLHLGSGVAHPLVLLAILGILVRWHVEERYRLPLWIATTALVLVFFSYCAVYLMTPYALAWQVQSSFDRLILQVWPAFLLVCFVFLRSVVDPAPVVIEKTAEARKSPLRSSKHPAAQKVK